MSKIAEKRTDEIVGIFHYGDYTDHSRHNTQWVAFKEGYDQAMQDFMEKAEEYLRNEFEDMGIRYIRGCSVDEEIEMFKNYMQDESEN